MVKSSSFRLLPQPTIPWSAIFALIIVTLVCLAGGAGKVVNYLFPLGSVAVGLLLYTRTPYLYIGFVWWLWLLAPLVRRLADYRGAGFTDPSPVLLSPYLVTFISSMALYHAFPRIHRSSTGIYLFPVMAIAYALAIGWVRGFNQGQIIGLLDWFAPVLFGFYLFRQWRHFPYLHKLFEKLVVWSVLILGAYGVFQYLVAPAWDTFWLQNTGITSMGEPAPLKIRVWSTLNSPEPFAAFMAACLLFLLNDLSSLSIPASIAGYLSFLLSLVRSSWLSWGIGILIFLKPVNAKFHIRLLLLAVVMVAILIPLISLDQFRDVIYERLETLLDLGNDGSANARKSTYAYVGKALWVNYVGDGLDGAGHDSMLLTSLQKLGWIGTISYLLGVIFPVVSLFTHSDRGNSVLLTSKAVVLGVLLRFPFNNVFLEFSGVLFWGFLSLGLASIRYSSYSQQISFDRQDSQRLEIHHS